MAVALFLASGITAFAADEAKDQFAAGSVWNGEIRVAGKEEAGKAVLTVSERMGESFKGEFIVRSPAGKVVTFQVSGTATSNASGAVIFETEKQEVSQLKLRGKLTNNAVNLVFVGTSPFGGKGGGALVLTPKL
ncbi:hypothetical protein [Planctomyces sp. SH-PL14]|uniref:hypothetical protein n=1 Tax=Planctomyces sp. SH-PL14 TaxID=1632864 RepID=UPI0012E7EBDC|nr:hypothetical protein [Planctomyces sp. SH-PL14]